MSVPNSYKDAAPRRVKLSTAAVPVSRGVQCGRWGSTIGRWLRSSGALIAAAQSALADPITISDGQRRDLLRRLREVGRAILAEQQGSDAALLLEGVVLGLQADLRWLQVCESAWTNRRTPK